MARIAVLGSLPSSLVAFRRFLIEAMIAQGHEVFACAPDAPDDVRAKLDEMGAIYCDAPLKRAGMNPLQDLATIAGLTRLFRRISPDVFLGYTAKPIIYGSLAAHFAGVPHIYSMIEGLGYAFSGNDVRRRLLASVLGAMYRTALRHNERVFYLNPDDIEFSVQQGMLPAREQAYLIGGIGVDLLHFSPRPLPRKVSFLMTSRLLRDKGVGEYVEAARQVRARHPEVRFRLLGGLDVNPNSVRPEHLQQWVDSGDIEYYGHQSDVRPFIADSAVCVLPSYYREGVPATLMEAMAMGRALITTDAPGCRETVEQGRNGFLVPVRDSHALAEAMLRFVEEPALVTRLGQESRRIAEERFDVHKVNRRFLDAMNLMRGSGDFTLQDASSAA